MNNIPINQLIEDVARDLITELAPQELPIFRANCKAYFSDSKKMLHSRQGKDEMLGFGVGETITLLTPYTLAVVAEIVSFLSKEFKQAIQAESASLISEQLRKLFRRFRKGEMNESDGPRFLTAGQLKQIRQLAFEQACQLKLSESKASLLADAVVGRLTLVD